MVNKIKSHNSNLFASSIPTSARSNDYNKVEPPRDNKRKSSSPLKSIQIIDSHDQYLTCESELFPNSKRHSHVSSNGKKLFSLLKSGTGLQGGKMTKK